MLARWQELVRRAADPRGIVEPCVFLDVEGHCLIHNVAPVNCRMFWMSSMHSSDDCHHTRYREHDEYGTVVQRGVLVLQFH